MFRNSLIILTIAFGVALSLLWSCSKNNHDTIAFVGDESDMKEYYDIYPQQYFPESEINQELKDGLFPPDMVGEYEVIHPEYSGTYKYYDQYSQEYVPYPQQAYTNLSRRSMYIKVEDQVNGMAKIKFSFKNNDDLDYKDWYEEDAYVYGNVYSENNNEFMLCYENTEYAGDAIYYRGNIIKGTVDSIGIHDIRIWSIIKKRSFKTEFHGIMQVYGYEKAVKDLAIRRK